MSFRLQTRLLTTLGAALLLSTALAGTALAAGPQIVAGPGADPDCFKPLTADTKYFQWPAKTGPYRIALVNGFIANDWRVQMIKVAKAYADQPDVKKDIKEFKVVSVGQDVAAQIAAVNNFIDQGYRRHHRQRQQLRRPSASVVKKANDAGVVLLSFDNIIDDPDEHPDQRRPEGSRRAGRRIPAQGDQGRPGEVPLRARSGRSAGRYRSRRRASTTRSQSPAARSR